MINKLKTNLKSDELWAVDLSPKTLVIGASASGKSAITQALELAVSGRLTDFQGRTDSALRTVQDMVTSAAEMHASVDPPNAKPFLRFREVRTALLQSGMAALDSLVGPLLAAELQTQRDEYWAFDKRASDAGKEAKRLEAVRDTIDAWETTTNDQRIALRDRILAASQEHDESKLASEGLRAVLWPELTLLVDRLCVIATKFIPTSLGRLFIDTGTPQSVSCRVGLQHWESGERVAGSKRFGLSGAEWNTAVTALAIALSDQDTSLVIPDDRAISRGLLSDWMEKLKYAKAQIVLTAIEAPDTVPDGWIVLCVSAPGKVSKWTASLSPVGKQPPTPRSSGKSPKRTSTGLSKKAESRAKSARKATSKSKGSGLRAR